MLHQQVARMIDNSAGCVSRMIMAHPSHVPIDDVIPVLVELLPLQEDWDENEAVWGMIIKLCNLASLPVHACLCCRLMEEKTRATTRRCGRRRKR